MLSIAHELEPLPDVLFEYLFGLGPVPVPVPVPVVAEVGLWYLPSLEPMNPRELVDIVEVRSLLQTLGQQWPYWAFFFNQVDDSIKLLGSCVCGSRFPGHGAVEIDGNKVVNFLRHGFDGMNTVFEKFGFPEDELESMSRGLVEVIEQAGMS